MMKPEPHALW